MRVRMPVISIACTPSQAANAIGPWTSRRLGPIAAIAELPRPIIAMMPLSLYLNGFAGRAGEVGEQVLGGPRAALQRHGAELGQRLAVRAGDVRDVADRVEAREALHRQVGLHVDAAAASLRHARRRRPARAP